MKPYQVKIQTIVTMWLQQRTITEISKTVGWTYGRVFQHIEKIEEVRKQVDINKIRVGGKLNLN